jgi:hypothetical protein
MSTWTDPQGYPEITMNPDIVRGDAPWRRTPTSDTEDATSPGTREPSPLREQAAQALRAKQHADRSGQQPTS